MKEVVVELLLILLEISVFCSVVLLAVVVVVEISEWRGVSEDIRWLKTK